MLTFFLNRCSERFALFRVFLHENILKNGNMGYLNTFPVDPLYTLDLSLHGENFMAIFITRSVVIWFSTGTVGIFATLVHVFTMRVVIYDILSMAIITTLSTSILFCNLYYIPL